MNTTELIERVAAEHGVAKEHTKKILDSVFTVITAAASAGDEVSVAGFGRFKVSDRAARQGTLARSMATRRANAASNFVAVWRTRSGDIATGTPSCSSHFPSRPSAQARNSSTFNSFSAVALIAIT